MCCTYNLLENVSDLRQVCFWVMQSPLWLWAPLQGSCSPYSGSAMPDSFDLVSPSFQYRQGKSLQRKHTLLAVLQSRSVRRHYASEPLARSTHGVPPHCKIAGMSSFLGTKKEGRPGYWCMNHVSCKGPIWNAGQPKLKVGKLPTFLVLLWYIYLFI